MQRIAIIDLGTNTFNLLIVEYAKNKKPKVIFKNKIPAKLGAGGFTEKKIKPKAFQRGLDALHIHKDSINEFGVFSVHAFGTSALRDASNSNKFLKAVLKETGIKVNIISGEKEAELIYNGVSKAIDIGPKPQLIMDIGGGSTEFIIADRKQILWKHSFDLGISRIWESLAPSDPLHERDIKALGKVLDIGLKLLFSALKQFPVEGLIGSSGSLESLAKLILVLKGREYDFAKNTCYSFKLNELQMIHNMLIKSTKKERKKMKGLVKYRLDTIPLASVFVMYIISRLKIKEMRLSTYALREGVMSEMINMA
ncbi:MAG TPA: phosphatase [Flavobacteriales bacterium]|nr:phosphatase [Flavobacteriales bacterium]